MTGGRGRGRRRRGGIGTASTATTTATAAAATTTTVVRVTNCAGRGLETHGVQDGNRESRSVAGIVERNAKLQLAYAL